MSRSKRSSRKKTEAPVALEKSATGIEGFDSITGGGLPKGRPTLVCGSPGCGKTLFGLQFVINGATSGEPGVVITFEESGEDLTKNVASLGVDLDALVRRKKVAIDYVHVDRSEILETGGYDLSGLFVRIEDAIDSIGAKRVLLDTLEVLFSGFTDMRLMRAELERLFRFLKDKGVTVVVTGEAGDGKTLTRHGIEEYVSDCVISLDQRISQQINTRRLRIVKYRGTSHGTNEYPFLIGETGISVLPITSLGLDYPVSNERVPTGIAALDTMLDGKGLFRGSSVLISGTAGTGKSSIVSTFVAEACARGEKCLFFALEEPAAQVVRNMKSIGVKLQPYLDSGLLKIVPARPTLFGLEQHLVSMHSEIEAFRPHAVIIDPISSLFGGENAIEVKSMLVRLGDYLKRKKLTCVFTYLAAAGQLEETDVGVSSLIDTWIELRDLENHGERNRAIYILKSRGMPHSNQVREFMITAKGLDLVDAFVGPHGVAIGSARITQAAEAKAARGARTREAALKQRNLERRRKIIEGQIEALRAELAAEEEEAVNTLAGQEIEDVELQSHRERMRQTNLGSGVRGTERRA